MLRLKKRRGPSFCTPTGEYFDTFIDKPTEIHGRITLSGSLRIDGKVTGNVESVIDFGSSVFLGQTGIVCGDIFAQCVHVAGLVEGNIYAKDKVVLHEGSEVRGDVTYSQISIEHGAKINGLLISIGEDQTQNHKAKGFSESLAKIKST